MRWSREPKHHAKSRTRDPNSRGSCRTNRSFNDAAKLVRLNIAPQLQVMTEEAFNFVKEDRQTILFGYGTTHRWTKSPKSHERTKFLWLTLNAGPFEQRIGSCILTIEDEVLFPDGVGVLRQRVVGVHHLDLRAATARVWTDKIQPQGVSFEAIPRVCLGAERIHRQRPQKSSSYLVRAQRVVGAPDLVRRNHEVQRCERMSAFWLCFQFVRDFVLLWP